MKPISLLLLLALGLSGCSAFSDETTKQQRAYEKYVRKSMKQREKQQAKVSKHQTDIPDSQTGPEVVNLTLDRSSEVGEQ